MEPSAEIERLRRENQQLQQRVSQLELELEEVALENEDLRHGRPLVLIRSYELLCGIIEMDSLA